MAVGEKFTRRIQALPGCQIMYDGEEAKDDIIVEGIDVNNVSLTCNFVGLCEI